MQSSEAEAREFIFHKESTNRLHAVNSQGCIGLGQNCPTRKGGVARLAIECPNWKVDAACQSKFWERYMKDRYGSWSKAKSFWLARVPINGKDVGNWW